MYRYLQQLKDKFQAKKNPLKAGFKSKTMGKRSLISTQRIFDSLQSQHRTSPKKSF
jgi:hypothetical protein